MREKSGWEEGGGRPALAMAARIGQAGGSFLRASQRPVQALEKQVSASVCSAQRAANTGIDWMGTKQAQPTQTDAPALGVTPRSSKPPGWENWGEGLGAECWLCRGDFPSGGAGNGDPKTKQGVCQLPCA